MVDLDRLADAIRSLNADILALQEVDRDQPRSHLADLTAVAADAMGAVTHRFAAALSGTPGAAWIAASENDLPGVASYGIALLSRYPALTPGRFSDLPRIPTLSRSTPHSPKDDHREGGAAGCGDRTAAHPGGTGRRRQHSPFLRAWLGAAPAAADPARPRAARSNR